MTKKYILYPLFSIQVVRLDLYTRRPKHPYIIIMEHSNKFHKSNIRYAKISLKVNFFLTQKRMQLVK